MRIPPRRPLRTLLAGLFAVSLLAGCELDSSSGDDGSGSGNTGNNNVNTGDSSSARQQIVGTWNVNTDWRWSQMTFHADGSRSVVEASTGRTLNRGSWRLEDGYLVVVSDVTERWSYTISGNTMTATLPSGTRVTMTKVN